jgi:DNA-binding winged helix-turn-helix (wHTH) protein
MTPASRFRVGDFVVDPGLVTLTGPGGTPSTLEPKILEVLEVLARRQGETVSADELLSAVWTGKFVGEAVVTRAISELRRALGDDAKSPRYIQTVARRGYRLIAEVREADFASTQPGDSAPVERSSGSAASPNSTSTRVRWLPLTIFGLAAATLAGVWSVTHRDQGPTPEAFRLYAGAQSALAGGSCVAHQAIHDLERALALSPTFVEAWEQYGWAKYNLVSSCGESGSAYTEATRAADRALELDPASSQAIALKAAVLTETGRADEARTLVEGHLEASTQTRFLAAYAATYAGDLAGAAERIEQVARRDPSFFVREGWTPNALLYLGQNERFLELVPEGNTPLIRFYRGYARHRSGDARGALVDLGPAFRERPSDPFARLAEALVAILEERDDEARLLLRQLALQRTRLGAADGEFTLRVAAVLAEAGDREGAMAEAERAVEQGFRCARCLSAEPAFASFADHERFARLLERAATRDQ